MPRKRARTGALERAWQPRRDTRGAGIQTWTSLLFLLAATDSGRNLSVHSPGFELEGFAALAGFAIEGPRSVFALPSLDRQLQRLRPWRSERAGFERDFRPRRNRARYRRERWRLY